MDEVTPLTFGVRCWLPVPDGLRETDESRRGIKCQPRGNTNWTQMSHVRHNVFYRTTRVSRDTAQGSGWLTDWLERCETAPGALNAQRPSRGMAHAWAHRAHHSTAALSLSSSHPHRENKCRTHENRRKRTWNSVSDTVVLRNVTTKLSKVWNQNRTLSRITTTDTTY